MELNQIKSYISKNIYTGLIKTIFTLVFSAVLIPMIIKNIGLGRFGIISIVFLFSSFNGVVDLGLSKALILLFGNKNENIKEITAIYILNLGIFLLIVIFGIIGFIFHINLLGKKIEINSETLRIINFIAVELLAFNLFNNLLRSSLEANFKLQVVNWGFLIQSSIINICWFVLSFFQVKIIFFLFIPIASVLLTIIFHLIFLPGIFSQLEKPNKKSFKKVYRISFQFFKVGVLNSIHLPLIKYSIIIFLGESRAIGIFELSTKLAGLANGLLAYLSGPLFSIVSKYHKSESAYLWKLIKKTTKILIGLSLLAYVIFFIFKQFIILYFFKKYTNEIFFVINLILIGYLVNAVSDGIQKYSLGSGKMNINYRVKFLGMLINGTMFLIFYLTNNLDLVNITFAYSISLTFIGIFWFFLGRYKLNELS